MVTYVLGKEKDGNYILYNTPCGDLRAGKLEGLARLVLEKKAMRKGDMVTSSGSGEFAGVVDVEDLMRFRACLDKC